MIISVSVSTVEHLSKCKHVDLCNKAFFQSNALAFHPIKCQIQLYRNQSTFGYVTGSASV